MIEMTQAARTGAVLHEIAAERRRQIDEEGYRPEDDDRLGAGELGEGAAAWASTKQVVNCWGKRADKRPYPRRRQLVIAAALAVAEIERLDRAEATE
jgi:hypothetical protein